MTRVSDVMMLDSDRQRIKALLTEAIMVLCKNGLSYKSQFCIEGLLGITLDQGDVFLVNIKETIFSAAKLQEIEEAKAQAKAEASRLNESESLTDFQRHTTQDSDGPPPQKRARQGKGQQERSPLYALSQLQPQYFNSPLREEEVIVIKEESATPDYGEADPSQESYPDQDASAMGQMYGIHNNFSAPYSISRPQFSSHPPIRTLPNRPRFKTEWDNSRDQAAQQANESSLEALSQVAAIRFQSSGIKQRDIPLDPNKRLEIQKAVLESDGCVVAARTICRKKNAKIHDVIRSMQAMTVPESEQIYVGNYKEISTGIKAIRVFYKCPPDKLNCSGLEKYSMTMDKYIELYFRSPRPVTNGPSNWPNYVEMLMRYCPYGRLSFPLDTMGLDEVEKQNVLCHLGSFCPAGLEVELDAILAVEDQR